MRRLKSEQPIRSSDSKGDSIGTRLSSQVSGKQKSRKSGGGKSRTKKKSCCCILGLIAGTVVLIPILVGLVGFLLLRKSYVQWEESFENSHVESDYVHLEGGEAEKLHDSIDVKSQEFSRNVSSVATLKLTVDEAALLVGSAVDASLPPELSVRRVFCETGFNDWQIYVQGTYNDVELPWVVIRETKDNIQTAELYTDSVSIGPYDVDDYGFSSVRLAIDDGFRKALLLVNESDFTGRTIVNIELEEDGVVVKGSQ